MALVAGYEDRNDHTILRRNPGLKTATKRRARRGRTWCPNRRSLQLLRRARRRRVPDRRVEERVLLRERAGAEDLRRAQAGTLRLRLIKLGARVTETARSVKLSLAGNYPRARDWIRLAGALGAVIG